MDSSDSLEAIFKKLVSEVRRHYHPKLVKFFEGYLSQPENFIDQCYKSNSKAPARMLHSLEQLVDLADESKLDSVKLFWLCVCAESLIKLSNANIRGSKKRVIEFFDQYLQADDRIMLENTVERSLGDDKYFDPTNKDFDPNFPVNLALDQIIGVFYSARSQLVHGFGTYFHFSTDGTPMSNLIEVNYANQDVESFFIALQYYEFRDMFIRAGINCIQRSLAQAGQ